MNTYANTIKNHLYDSISELDTISSLFLQNPGKDFTRIRKLDFRTMVEILLTMGGQNLKLEIMNYFSFGVNTPTASAFVQQRHKILPDAFNYLFHDFTKKAMSFSRTFNGYRLLAVDGSNLSIFYNPDDTETHFPNRANAKGFNHLQINALYDICNKIFVDVEIYPGRRQNERKALLQMIDRMEDISDNTIIIADRGYEGYHVFEYIKQKNLNCLFRVKDITGNGITSSLKLPHEDCFDVDYRILVTRRHTKEIRTNPDKYKCIRKGNRFDFLPVNSKDTYPIEFRIVRFPISEDTYEILITNLNRNDFPIEKLKEIYHMRWGIETAFRELKYTIGLINLHSKKVEFIVQEIYARLIMYNFCELITLNTVIKKNKGTTKHMYQVNYTIAIAICRHFMKYKGHEPPDIEALIAKNILPVRPGRKDPRKVKKQATVVSFLYRIA